DRVGRALANGQPRGFVVRRADIFAVVDVALGAKGLAAVGGDDQLDRVGVEVRRRRRRGLVVGGPGDVDVARGRVDLDVAGVRVGEAGQVGIDGEGRLHDRVLLRGGMQEL